MSADYTERIDALARRAAADRRAFEPPTDPPDAERAMAYLREGFGPAVWTYVEGRTGDGLARFDPAAFERLEGAMNEWLELYAACHGETVTADASVREAAELLLDTRNVADTAQVLTHVPARENHHKR
jgi:hypothetical protein